MTIKSVFDPEFAEYGKVVEGYDFTELLGILRQISPKPEDAVIYVPSVKELEALPVCKDLSDRAYGGMPIQIGYCNGAIRSSIVWSTTGIVRSILRMTI